MKEVKKKSGKEKKRKRKNDSSSHGESATKRASLDIIRTAIPLQARSAEGETSIPPGEAPISYKVKEKAGESSTAPEPRIEEVYIVAGKSYPSSTIPSSMNWVTRV